MGSKRRKFSDEFKIEAVKLMTEQGMSTAAAARDLGVSGSILGRWKQQSDQGLLGDTPARREADDMTALRKEIKRLRMERDILKKATAYFARESL
jgi:transposase